MGEKKKEIKEKRFGKAAVRVLFEWQAMDRPFNKRNKEFFTTVISLAFLASIFFFFFMKEIGFVIVIWAAVFLTYVLSTVPPSKVVYKITTQGLITGNHSYIWPEIGSFWFEESSGERLLHMSLLSFPWRLSLLVDRDKEDEITEAMVKYIPFREKVEKGRMDKIADWFSEKLS